MQQPAPLPPQALPRLEAQARNCCQRCHGPGPRRGYVRELARDDMPMKPLLLCDHCWGGGHRDQADEHTRVYGFLVAVPSRNTAQP